MMPFSEPWSVRPTLLGGQPKSRIVDCGGQHLCDTNTAYRSEPEAEAYARRLVACVNACAGIGTESLEAGAVAELVGAARRAATALAVYARNDTADEQGWVLEAMEKALAPFQEKGG